MLEFHFSKLTVAEWGAVGDSKEGNEMASRECVHSMPSEAMQFSVLISTVVN